jgi:hypothetical protein
MTFLKVILRVPQRIDKNVFHRVNGGAGDVKSGAQ